MKLFQSLQKFYRITGIYPSSSNRNHSVNWKILLILLSLIQFAVLTGVFFITEANSIDEYGTSFYGSISALLGVVDFLINIWKMANILRLIGKFEEFINKRKTVKWIFNPNKNETTHVLI